MILVSYHRCNLLTHFTVGVLGCSRTIGSDLYKLALIFLSGISNKGFSFYKRFCFEILNCYRQEDL